MPTHIRAHVTWQTGSLLPRDKIQITPCFRHQQILPVDGGPEWDDLAEDLATGIRTSLAAGNAQALEVKLYEIKDPVAGEPNRPKGQHVLDPANAAEAQTYRELACCLSFYGGENAPHQRGRLYVPAFLLLTTSTVGVRPATVIQNKAGALATVFAGLGGIDVDWIVWSPTRKLATRVTNWFVDDEWDVQRRRGLVPAVRVAGTTGG
jgi:hypothetical protein